MMPLLVFRERVKNIYHRYDIYIKPVIKFIFAFIAFQMINREIGYDTRLESLPVILGLSLLSAITPSAVMVLLATGVAILHVYVASPILSIIIVVLLLIIYFLFARFTPHLGYVLLAVPILYFLKVPYLMPILLGIVSTPIAIIPMACGVVVYYIIRVIQTAVTMQVNTTVDDILQLYTYVMDSIIDNKQMILSIVIFALILIVVYYVRKLKFDYAFEISIAAGALASILGFLISDFLFGQSDKILSMILGTLASAAIVYIIQFFQLTLDYSGVENVQFEDDVYYYYVKAVPKVTVTTPQMKVKHINTKNAEKGSVNAAQNQDDLEDDEEYDDEDDGYSDN
ncbi:ABC transporter permease [Lachnospiraceae bacterium MD1]|uniref:ABC transporter permease n=1 Tax=Variimorphobacter saccharofermentans TaxID=2755051 RepID=A0A839JXA9_9FIRM|nr:ABC transporter permease [Variimorphobacter saccharofermentans]MBB2181914.1 ABC transporter permease [Variimorphobacter saccharofermentans]